MSGREVRTRDLAKGVVNDVADGYRAAIAEDPQMDPYAKANARLGLAIGQLLANVAVDAIADYVDEE